MLGREIVPPISRMLGRGVTPWDSEEGVYEQYKARSLFPEVTQSQGAERD